MDVPYTHAVDQYGRRRLIPKPPIADEEPASEMSEEQALAWLEEAIEHTRLAIEWWADYRTTVSGRRSKDVVRRVERLFESEIFWDPILGCYRAVTLPELMRPDVGKTLIRVLKPDLENLLGEVGLDMLRAARVFMRFIQNHGAQTPNGPNLRKRWGHLVCPIDDFELPKRKVKSEVFLPHLDQLAAIYEAVVDWATAWRRPTTGWRTATIFVLCMESGLRGIEARTLSLSDQCFDLRAGVASIQNPLVVLSAKGQPPRLVSVLDYGFAFLKQWLTELRPIISDDPTGVFFPSTRGSAPLSSASLSETTRSLIGYLRDRQLLHASFTFHATRKFYATNFSARTGRDLLDVINQCGWTSTAQFPVYIRPTTQQAAAAQKAWQLRAGARGGLA